jgi:hypothetical protein
LKDEDVAIVKMDATNNDVPSQYEVRGFPTLYWAPKDAKESPVRYEVSIKFLCTGLQENQNATLKSEYNWGAT